MLLESISTPSDIRHFNSDQLLQLCKELHAFYIKSISATGGHLGASLGVLELSVAVHYVFDTPRDKLIWDVGHQAHFHKILTGRRNKITTQRQEGGISGFTKRSESVYDPFGAGHSSTSVSAALGMEVGRLLQNKDNRVIAVIGDGAMSAGMAYEALNNAGSLPNNLIVILNDNRMSISPTVGALSQHLSQLVSSTPYSKVKNVIKSSINRSPVRSFFKDALKRLEKVAMIDNNIFENLGFEYLGPIDGHNLHDLISILKSVKADTLYPKAKGINKPILLHVITQKGKGFYSPNGGEDEDFHAVSKFCCDTYMQDKGKPKAPTYTKVFADSLIREAKKDDRIVAITAAMPSGTGLAAFQKEFPNRCFDVGIAEQHAVTFAAGLACENMNPFVAIYSTFLQRAYDQVIHDVAVQKLPVKFAIDRAGLVGEDGPTHAGSFDVAYIAIIPNFVVMAPSDENELSKMVATAAAYDEGPIAFRYPRGEAQGVKIEQETILEIGKGRVVREGTDIAILSLGSRLHEALAAATLLEHTYNISATVADARFAKPIDTQLVTQLIKQHKLLITIEEGSIGGFASQVNHFILQHNLNQGVLVRNLFLPDYFIEHAKVQAMHEAANLTSTAIINIVTQALNLSNVASYAPIPFTTRAQPTKAHLQLAKIV